MFVCILRKRLTVTEQRTNSIDKYEKLNFSGKTILFFYSNIYVNNRVKNSYLHHVMIHVYYFSNIDGIFMVNMDVNWFQIKNKSVGSTYSPM